MELFRWKLEEGRVHLWRVVTSACITADLDQSKNTSDASKSGVHVVVVDRSVQCHYYSHSLSEACGPRGSFMPVNAPGTLQLSLEMGRTPTLLAFAHTH